MSTNSVKATPSRRKAASTTSASVEKSAVNLAVRLRLGRETAAMTVRELARRAGVSPSLVSQIERGRVMPSVATLYSLSNCLGLVIDDLFKGEDGTKSAATRANEPGPLQRQHNRKSAQMAAGVCWERLTAEPDHDVEFLYVVYEAGAQSCPEDALFQHRGTEYVYLLSGRLGARIDFDEYELAAGDSMSFDSQRPHRFWCIGKQAAIGIWTIIRRRGDDRVPIDQS